MDQWTPPPIQIFAAYEARAEPGRCANCHRPIRQATKKVGFWRKKELMWDLNGQPLWDHVESGKMVCRDDDIKIYQSLQSAANRLAGQPHVTLQALEAATLEELAKTDMPVEPVSDADLRAATHQLERIERELNDDGDSSGHPGVDQPR